MPEGSWPKDDKMSELTDVHAQTVKQERRKKIVGLLAKQSSDEQYALVLRYSSFERLLRITAWLFRFVKNCRLPKEMQNNSLVSVKELLQAERQWFRRVQKGFSEDEINCIVKHKALRSSSKLLMFDPYLDEDRLLRVGGRLESASIQEAAKHQILLPHNHVVVDLLVRRFHERQLHAGVEHTLAILRQRVWILRARSCVKRNIRNCVVCKAQRTQKMSSLPVERVKATFAFENTGLDFAGPIYVRRRRTCEKAYICLFTCMTTRAIHLELVPDMTAPRFVQALRRFFARRGRPAIIQSDNFKTFKSASRELQQLFNEDNSERIDEPPHTLEIYNRESTLYRWILGTVGEISERSTTKDSRTSFAGRRRHVYSTLRRRDYGQCQTFDLLSLPECGTADRSVSGHTLRQRWRYHQQLLAHFWRRWKEEYITTLSGRKKWNVERENPRVNDVVLVAEDNVPRHRWRLGIVVELLPGEDGLVRTVRVKTAAGVISRPTRKLHLLESASSP
ncbi:hypothetical protein TTRE_0000644401 [Trichuris trichiura]|uniref:Integrase catalytic domain-containing protein n=1 Tax=Trichuris trichiura TaxID=36087 RepID=A0A077ZHS0_TRITR|nr:hypothetical protein TTRE_0000644401 [Trichuris trichiura]